MVESGVRVWGLAGVVGEEWECGITVEIEPLGAGCVQSGRGRGRSLCGCSPSVSLLSVSLLSVLVLGGPSVGGAFCRA